MPQIRRAVSFRRVFADFWRAVGDEFGGYHPERHYMRGPGPKWREMHGIPEGGREPSLGAPALGWTLH